MSSPDPTLLLQELLSPRSLDYNHKDILQLITYHLSSLPLESPHLDLISLIGRYTLSSPSLWPPTSRNTSYEQDVASWNGFTAIYSAFFQSTLLRLDLISREVGTGFRARRSVSKYLSALSQGLWVDQVRRKGEDEAGKVEPVNRLLLVSAVLAALQEWKRRKERLWVGGRGMLDRIEMEAGRAWTEWVENGGELFLFINSSNMLPAWIVAQTIASIQSDVLAKDFPSNAFLNYLTEQFAEVFDQGNLFTSPPLAADLEQASDGLLWRNPSPSHDHLSHVVQSPLFGILGPLSRSLGRLLSANANLATSYDSSIAEPAVLAIRDLSHTIFTISTRLSSGWAATPWSDLVEDSSLSPSTRSQTQPWTILKSLLFAQTLIYSSLLEIVSSDSSGIDDEPTSVQRELAREAVVAIGRTYFVASRFGQGGFKAWRSVLAGLVDVATAPSSSSTNLEDRLTPAEELVRKLESSYGDEEDGTHSRLVDRAEVTFWMNTVEQVMDELSDSYVENTVLPGCKPYLDNSKYSESFESAHSVFLAIFSSEKGCVPDLTHWYTDLLLKLPSLSPTQLRVAYSTVVRSASSFDDALAWKSIQDLVTAIERLPVSTLATESSNLQPTQRPRLRALSDDDSDLDTIPSNQSSVPAEEPVASTIETRVLTLPRGPLLLSLISLLPSVNLVLFRSLLAEITRLVDLEPVDSDGRKALGEWTFEVLGAGMDVVKHQEGVRWWMEHGRELIAGVRVESESVEVEQAEAETMTEMVSAD
ncbi:uncharacterized protein JCM6883_003119 [Sporobolomyces salmoneus]|uniref:uncharacterized protein n=1 Tax=Sporobolomyces salmoneus TaxID=183962 RepID=UPI00317F6DBA